MNNTTDTTKDQALPAGTVLQAEPPFGNAAQSTALAKIGNAGDRSDRMALEPANFGELSKLAMYVVKSGLFKVTSMEDAFVRVMTGRALGLPMFASLKGIYSVGGAVGLESKLKVALCRQRPDCEHFRCLERSATSATWEAKRKGDPAFKLTFTIEEAKAAGLLDYATPEKKAAAAWTRFPADMLMARASGKLADIVFPEASLGLPSKEELEDERAILTTGESVPDVEPTVAPPNVIINQRDFDAEAQALKDKIAAAQGADGRKALRPEIAQFLREADPENAASIKAFYNIACGVKRETAQEGGQ
jgi:hypothetical protein